MGFKKAVRTKAKLRLAIDGISGSGKTYSALRIATGLGGKIALIDTEEESSRFYADRFDFDADFFHPPYSPDKFVRAIKEASDAGYKVLLVDSFTHAWDGTGGILDIHERLAKAKYKGNGFSAWAEVTPMHKAIVDAILSSDLHVIVTMRTKTEYAVTEGEKGRMRSVQKIGTKVVQRKDIDFEFTTVFDISVPDHLVVCDKDRTGLFGGCTPFVPTEDTGKAFAEYLAGGAEPEPVVPTAKERFDDVRLFVREQIAAGNSTKSDWVDCYRGVMGNNKTPNDREVDELMDRFTSVMENGKKEKEDA